MDRLTPRERVVNTCRAITLFTLMATIGQTEEAIKRWLQPIGLVPYMNPGYLICPETGNDCHEMARDEKRDLVLQYRFYCKTCRKRRANRNKICNAMASNTWLSGTHLPVEKVMKITYLFVCRIPVTAVEFHCGISHRIAIDWYSFCRQVCQKTLEHYKIGGDQHIVEIDEHHLVTPKYHTGHGLAAQNIIFWGAIDTTSHQVVMKRIPNKSNAVILPLIAAHIRENSTIHSDGRYEHQMDEFLELGMANHNWVNHSTGTYAEQVVDPNLGETTVTTNHIERQWKELKEFVKSHQSDGHIDQYIDQYLYWKNRNFFNLTDGERFGHFLYDIAQAYPGIMKKRVIDTQTDPPMLYIQI